MKKSTHILRTRPWLVLLALFAWLLPQRAHAVAYLHDPDNYSVSLGGTNIVYFEAPVYDCNGLDQWITDGNLKVSVDGGTEYTVFSWHSAETDINNSNTSLSCYFSTPTDGFFDITLGNTHSTSRLTKSNAGNRTLQRNSDGLRFSFSAEWVVPYNLLGKTLKFTWEVKRDGNGYDNISVTGLKSATIKIPEASAKMTPFVSPAMLNNNNPGKLEVPWYIPADDLVKASYEYDDGYGKHHSVEIKDMKNGTIMLDANEPHRNFCLMVSYNEKGEKGTYLIENQKSDVQNIAMIHAPTGLTLTPSYGNNAKVELKWSVPYMNDEDLTPTDFFEIQRSLTGKEEDFVTIFEQFYAKTDKKSVYTYTDSTLVEAITERMLKNGGTLDNVTYRVRRVITKEWGWSSQNNCATTASCALDKMHLLRIADYTSRWEDQRAYTVRVSWDYAADRSAVWDERAEMKVLVLSRNRDGEQVDSTVITLNPTERQQRYTVVNLSRSCVYYDIKVYVERGESPLQLFDGVEENFFPIRNADDWKEFKNRVQVAEGKYDVNARLYADITTDQLISWESRYAYRGVFDGNGHTITFNLADTKQEIMAPFRYVGNATIKDLRTAGTVNTSERYAAGLIGKTMEGTTVSMENCRSSVTLKSSVSGNVTGRLAGFIARQSGSNALIRNSKFDGGFEGANATHNCGFVAWVARGSSLAIDNCVFAPDHITTKFEGCQTWADLDTEDVKYSNINSYTTREYSAFIVIRSAADWHQFAVMVNDATNRYWVDAVLDADITVSEHVGVSDGAYYRGTFNGNGHTITFNKSGWSERYIAPFRYVGNATIKNLHTAGTISSSNMYATGLVAYVVSGGNLTIENCHSSMTINNSGSSDMTSAGFVGRVSGGNVTIRNSKFDGSFEGANSYGHGGFVSWVAPNSNVTIENCLFAPDHLSVKFDLCDTWARKDADASAKVTVTNSHATKHMPCEFIEIGGQWFMVLKSTTDWGYFVEALKTNPATNAIMDADFGIVTSADNFNGIFDGNGHILNINIDGGLTEAIAIFKNAPGCTIKNLHVTGYIKGGNHLAALVGVAGVANNKWTDIFNCRISANIVSSDWLVGGFVGRGTHANIQNCLFDGRLECQKAQVDGSQNWAGVFFGFKDGERGAKVTDAAVSNCVENTTWRNIIHMYTNVSPWRRWGNDENEWTKNNYTYNDLWVATDCSKMAANDLANKLGSSEWEAKQGASNWIEPGVYVYPIMHKTAIPENPWLALSAAQQVEALGNGNWTVSGGKVVPIMPTNTIATVTNEESFLNKLGNGWTLEGGVLVPVATATTVETNPTITTHTAADFTQYYHSSNGKIDPELLTETRQSSVLLTWNTDGNPIDFYTVLRRNKGQGDDKWEEIATNLDQMSYEDVTTSPLLEYEYKVRATNQCEGITTTETQVKAGRCKGTGRVEGYVRFNDGTGVAGIQVEIEYNGTKVNATTDESGYYVADELSYQGKTDITYNVTPVAKGGVEIKPTSSTVNFNAHSNNETMGEFTVNNGKRFSGFVMYEGTSIPLKGANFKVNGELVHSANGKLVETDYDGSFSFRVLPGVNTIQVVKDGHKFIDDGYYKSPDGHNFTADVANTYLYDDTKVKLTGRVVGGNDQGKMPLMNNLSKNNLGDSLQIVLTLEGDNTSWLVYENTNPNKTERDTIYQHRLAKGGEVHKTEVNTTRKRMVIWPDVKTGEYEVMLPPVRWKVMQVYCKGYPTLFQEGQVNDIIDLTDCLTEKDTTYVGSFKDVDQKVVTDPKASYNAIYNRIYHSPVEVTYKQMGYDNFDYFGDKNYMASSLDGKQHEVPLAYQNPADTTQALYTFNYPVFSMERKYRIQLQVAESYLYNNDPKYKPDLVRLDGGIAYMQNGMKGDSYKVPQELDSLGQTIFTVLADQTVTLRTNTPEMMTGENALKTVTFTVLRDGTYYEAKPLQGFVLNMFPLGASQDILTEGVPLLYDILRDPPGGYSTNTLAKGATLNYTYMMNLSATAGIYMNFKGGTKLETFTGTVAAPQGVGTAAGPISISDTWNADVDMLMYNAQGSKAFSHTMVIGNNISTSGDPSMVGADADLYIGTVQNVVVTPMSTIRAVPDSMYKVMSARTGAMAGMTSDVGKYDQYGTVIKLAEGETIDKDGKKKKFHLIRDVSLGYGPKVNSQFVYSQKQLLNQIIPAKAKEIVDMMYCGTKDEAQAIANNTQKPVYLSLREPTDPKFAMVNSKDKLKNHAYNDSIDKAEDGINYLVVIPKDRKASEFSDEVAEKYQVIKAWVDMIALNENEKLHARDLLANYDIAGAAGVNYSETFDASYSNSFTQHFPIATEVDYFELGKGASNAFSAVGLAGTIVGGLVASLAEMKSWKVPDSQVHVGTDENGLKAEVLFGGKFSQFTIVPVISYTTIGTDSETKSYNRTESFTIACDPNSHLNVDVYRVGGEYTGKKKINISNVFVNDNFNQYYDMVKGHMEKTLRGDSILGPRSFVFRTRGGATQNPWEDKRVTKITDPGAQLDARTLKIVNPVIRLDKQSVSGVAIDDAAKFTIYVSNESEKPEATDGLTALQLFAPDQANWQGAKISVNGQQLTTGGMTISVIPGQETALQMEVRAGQGFDYEGLTVGVMSPSDMENALALTTFDVHFLHEAGGVSIATPGDKWVMNTEAQQDPERGWYIPVIINGFDRYQHNFDHVELQYKESQRGDDAWTNLCSFYCDSTLMANANGVKKMMPTNGNIVTEFFGDGWVTEKNYDLRAVLFCRNGSDFLTTPSKIISGVKDTRRPQLFGTPEPKNGLLTSGDNIIFNFSEDIEKNNLSAITNFEVRGEVNNADLQETVSVQFTGKGSIETEAKRNFSGKDLTIDLMVKPDTLAGRDMPLFSHGTNGQKLQLWLTKDFKLKAVVNNEEFVSDSVINKMGFSQVALVIRQEDDSLTFFNGGVQAGKKYKLSEKYTGTGTLIFGRTNDLDRSKSQYYQGRMMEARLWYNAMSGGLIGTTYGSRRLTGYEKDLVDYYPMNEGSGDYVTDHTQGANAKLINASWAIPRGMSLHVEKADKGVLLNQKALNRTSEHDYTLMFWFKTDAEGRGTLLSNGRGLKEDNGAKNQFHIGFEGDKLMYRSNGFSVEVPGDWSDGQWHNFAMTVNRGRNVANIYMDKEQVTTFEADNLGGISGGYPLIGATRYDVIKENGDVEVVDGTDALKGNVDELLFFAQALPQQLINTYATKSPNGDESGLLTYLAFDRIERQKDNDLELVPYAYSKKLYLDDKGNPRYQLDPLTKEPTDTLVRDYLFVDEMDAVMKHFDKTQAAPVVPYEEVKNLKFSFIGKGNQLLVELDEPAARLNHRNVYVTVRDIEDLNGNTMASPQTACYYVTNSSLQWLVNKLDVTIKYGSDEQCELPFYNNGASSHNYTIENCPKWLTLDKYTDVVAPQFLESVTAKVNKDLNIGTYNEIIYLTDEEGITEPLYLNLTVEGEQPEWVNNVDGDLLENSMSISGQVYIYDELDTDSRDIVGVFDNENVCHGYANISHDVQTGETALFLTVYDNQASGRELNFRLWQYSTGREIMLTPNTEDNVITFEKSAVLGTGTPVRFDGGEAFVQYFNLKKGWNWVSFNVESKDLSDINKLLGNMTWSDGDVLTELCSNLTLTYEKEQKQWLASGSTNDIVISPKKSYAIMVHKDCTFPIGGTVIKQEEARTIDVKKGWNAVGYTPMTNLAMETALSDYYDQAEEGDVIKSHTEFAYFTKSGNTGRWRGNLQYMKPGEGYMLLRKADGEASFTYPFYEMGSNIYDVSSTSQRRVALKASSTMSVSAIVEGFDVEEGDKLVAYADGEIVGSEVLSVKREELAADDQPLFFLSIAGDAQQPIWFAIERDGEIVASTDEVMTFERNAVIGSPDEPTAINFEHTTDTAYENGKWYTLSGVQLPQKPTEKGLYIFNGKKVFVK